ncbi:hypothetical protein GCM10027515_19230 [Schumannella luteola]|uniref:Multidrug efflux pump subunit AcrA (Membrane-fusion protein) n=1 Tax=Schumannella luteola TaxID=472059 RepID=A0A852YGK9_9MICO|nr:hypothetical protein [Schumannella luteola]NYH00282.1 multidrug efflux pump subunit AcrA (membrane-fusion protein) [Schumannella luteola]TPX01476.1 hypothetical protein FJ656_27190 [Schumannella luteola]
MGIARKWVFPILRLVVIAAIAVALVKLAFIDGLSDDGKDSARPTGQIVDPTVSVTKGTITNEVKLDATVSADPAAPVKATLAGEVTKITAALGAPVAADTPVAVIRSETISPEGQPIVKTVTVKAGSGGVLSALPIIVGQQVAVGDAIGQVAPPTFSVTGSLAAADQYRLLNRPTEATVTITGGPAPFTCTGLSITTPLNGAGAAASAPGDGDGAASATPTTTVRCAVPAEVTVFTGLAAKMSIAGGVATDVLTVPATAVQGSAGTGVVYVPDAKGGKPVKKDVKLGLSDGKDVEITEGLAEGDEILQFVPGAPAKVAVDGAVQG